jgi:hypothetical protein
MGLESSGNEKQFSEGSHKSRLLVFPTIYLNMFIQFTYEVKSEVIELLNYR